AFGQVLVLDWGLARRAGAEAGTAGTPGFMAPEQQRGEAVDARADIYSLGAILATLLPPGAPAALAAIAAKAHAPRPDHPSPAAAAFAAELPRFLDGERVLAAPEGLLRRARRVAARHRVALGILAAYLVGRALIFFLTHP